MEIFSATTLLKAFLHSIYRERDLKKAGSYLADDVFGLEQRDVSTAFAVQKTI